MAQAEKPFTEPAVFFKKKNETWFRVTFNSDTFGTGKTTVIWMRKAEVVLIEEMYGNMIATERELNKLGGGKPPLNCSIGGRTKVPFIRFIRETHGIGLREAKYVVDTICKVIEDDPTPEYSYPLENRISKNGNHQKA